MIYGIGNDILELQRIAKSISSERFMTFCFSQSERDSFCDNAQKLGGCFCAKEALSKALGTGVRGFAMDEISVMRDEIGKPYFIFEGEIAEIMCTKKLKAFVAITNTNELIFANVVLETENS